jgi:hypothetical protein
MLPDQLSPAPARIPRHLTPFTRALCLAMAVACLIVFAADQVRLAQMPIGECAGPDTGCAFSEITAADVGLLEAAGLSRTLFGAAAQILAVIARLSLPLVGVVLFWRRPDEWVTWCQSLAFLSVLTEGAAGLGRLIPLAQVALAVGVLAWLPVPFIFPNGRLEPRRLRWPIAIFMGVAVVAWTPALGMRVLPAEPLAWLNVGVGLAWAALSGYSLVYRYRFVSTVVERQQTKWVIAGFVAVFCTTTTYVVAAALFIPGLESFARPAGRTDRRGAHLPVRLWRFRGRAEHGRPALPAVGHRHRHPAHAGLRHADDAAGPGVLRSRNHNPAGVPQPDRAAWPWVHHRLDTLDGGVVPTTASAGAASD